MKRSKEDLKAHSQDWWDGHDIGKEENLENVALGVGIIIGIFLGMGLVAMLTMVGWI
jgi:hypothetical protein